MALGDLDACGGLTAALPDRPELAPLLAHLRPEIEAVFTGAALEAWLESCRRLADEHLGNAVLIAYLRASPGCARLCGTGAAVELGRAAAAIGRIAGPQAVRALLQAAPRAAELLAAEAGFETFLGALGRLAHSAPEALPLCLERVDTILGELDAAGFEGWALEGVRLAAGDPQRRIAYFSLADHQARRALYRGSRDLVLSDVERRLKAYLRALWRQVPTIRPASQSEGARTARRANFQGKLVRMPETFRGFTGAQAEEIFRAAFAHIAAHHAFTPARFPVGSLKPIQVALVSLVEDARVEALALRRFPGLHRLWQPFHLAQPGGPANAPGLMARLSRALIDPDFADDNPWIVKGRAMFAAERENLEDQALSRRIGNLLGNDLGQMRVQFNPKTYVVEPAYRDDNLGLWDFGDQPPPPEEEIEAEVEAVRIDQAEDDQPPDRERETPPEAESEADPEVGKVAFEELPPEAGVAVARYPEWDYLAGHERPDWTTLVEYPPQPGYGRLVDHVLETHPALTNRIAALVQAARVSRPVRLKRQAEGEWLDIDACISAAISRRLGETPDPRVYGATVRRDRDLSVLLLLDVSESTNDRLRGSADSVIKLEREATAFLAHAMAEMGDPFALHAFSSDGREDVRYLRLKDFGRPYDAAAKAALAGLTGGYSTRLGAAIRHAAADLQRQSTYRRLLLVVTDGEPADVDVSDRRYLVEDARKAVQGLAQMGIDVFCVGLDSGGASYLNRIFGARNVVMIDRIERLPEKLPMLYFRLTA